VRRVSHHLRSVPPRAFTLIELVVGVVVVAILAGATAASLGQLVRTRSAAIAQRQAVARATDAASRMALDIASSVRDANLAACKVQVMDSGAGEPPRDELLLLVRSSRPVRGLSELTGSPEGNEYEAQYRVVDAGRTSTLWMRRDSAQDGIVDGGGIAAPIIPGLIGLSVQAFDGTNWKDEWDSDADGLPHAIRVTVTAVSDERGVTALARRTVAIDRVPVEPRTEGASSNQESGSGESSAGSPSQGSGTGGGQ
jgi:type II secretion system protein J